MIREIINDYEKLSRRSVEFSDPRKEGTELHSVLVDIKDTMQSNDLVGLSAIQIDLPRRVFTIQFAPQKNKKVGQRLAFINPYIVKASNFTLNRESTPVIPGKEFICPRYGEIEACYYTPLGEVKNVKLVGASAFLFEQLFDSLEGILPSDIGLELPEEFDAAPPEEQDELIQAYFDTLGVRLNNIQEEIKKDPDSLAFQKSVKFDEAVRNGEVELMSDDEFAGLTDAKQCGD